MIDHETAIKRLKARVKELEEIVARLERDSHPPVDLRPAIRAAVEDYMEGREP